MKALVLELACFGFFFTFPREKTFSNYRHGPKEWVSTVKLYPGKKKKTKTVAYLEKHIIVLEHLKMSYSTADASLRAGAAVPKCNAAKGTKLMYESCVQRRPGASSYFVMLWGYGCSLQQDNEIDRRLLLPRLKKSLRSRSLDVFQILPERQVLSFCRQPIRHAVRGGQDLICSFFNVCGRHYVSLP